MSLRDRYYKELFDCGLQWEKRGIISVVKASCKHCGETYEMNLATHLPPDQIVKKVRTLGWLDKSKAWTCDKCINHSDTPLEIIKEGAIINDEIKRIFAPVSRSETPALPKPDSMVKPTYRQIRKAMALIEGNFDVDNGTWLEGWSDDKLAEEVGIARNVAFMMREDAFGALKRPPELDQLLSEVKAAVEMISDISVRVASFAQRYR
jgi:hypothetical protein